MKDIFFSIQNAPSKPWAIVLGAGINPDGTATKVLFERVKTGAELFFAGKVERILLSGDNRDVLYNEPEAMRLVALGLGVPNNALFCDPDGKRTYDTCIRAIQIYKIKAALLVTQPFHLPRSVYIARSLGMDAVGIVANYPCECSAYDFTLWHLREIPAFLRAFYDVAK